MLDPSLVAALLTAECGLAQLRTQLGSELELVSKSNTRALQLHTDPGRGDTGVNHPSRSPAPQLLGCEQTASLYQQEEDNPQSAAAVLASPVFADPVCSC